MIEIDIGVGRGKGRNWQGGTLKWQKLCDVGKWQSAEVEKEMTEIVRVWEEEGKWEIFGSEIK